MWSPYKFHLSFIFAMVTLAVVPRIGMGASDDHQFAMQGRGGQPCQAFVKARKAQDNEYLRFASWTAGYVTAFNQFDTNTVDIAPWQGLDLLSALLAQHCETHPKKPFAKAVADMTKALYPQRLRKQSKLVSIKTDAGGTLQVYDTVIRRAQAVLKHLGLYEGDATGNFDSATRSALKKFQASQKTKETGVPNQDTLYRLFQKAPSDLYENYP